MNQLLEELLWRIIETFYQGFASFHKQTKKYQDAIARKGYDKNIRTPKEVNTNLFDGNKLKKLIENYFEPLCELAQDFRQAGNQNSFFADHCQDIYYELSILHVEFCKLKASLSENSKLNKDGFISFFEEFNIRLPLKIFQLINLLQSAKKELENIIVEYKDRKIFLQSAFLFGEEVIGPVYKQGFNEFIKKIYPNYLLEFYTRAASYFKQSGFNDKALNAIKKAQKVLEENDHDYSDKWKQKFKELDEIIKQKKIL